VGKNDTWGRLIQHLGYYKVNRTQGFINCFIGKELNLNFKLISFEFEAEMTES
jgi:hypothetical protein